MRTVFSLALLAVAASFSTLVFAQDTAVPPGTPDPIGIYDVNQEETITGSNLYPDTTRIVVGEGGTLNFAPGASAVSDQAQAESGLYIWNGGKVNMAEGSSFTAHKLDVGTSDPGGATSGYRRVTGDSEGTFNAKGATVNASVTVTEFGTANFTDTTVNNPVGIPENQGFVANFGGKINATNSTFNLDAPGWTNYNSAEATVKGGAINGKVINGVGSTFKAEGTSLNGTVYNQQGGIMYLDNSVASGIVNSFSGNNVLGLDNVTIKDMSPTNQRGRMIIGNELHVGSQGVDMNGGYVQFFNNDAYNPGTGKDTTLTLALTDSLLSGAYDAASGFMQFFLSDFIENSAFYWYGADGVQQNNLGNYWEGFDFVFDLSDLEDASFWTDLFSQNGYDIVDGTSYASGIDYDFANSTWETGHGYDVRFSFGNNENVATTPEPASLLIVGLGLCGLPLCRRLRRKTT